MRLPEPLFPFINYFMRILLRSPIHGLVSKNLMLITFRGRKSGKQYCTPVRYIRVDDTIQCFSSAQPRWWRNLRGGADVTLRLQGKDQHYHATVIENDPEKTREALVYYLGLFPQDAVYHDIRLTRGKGLEPVDLDRASRHSAVIEARPV